MRYMLDTDIVSELIKNPRGKIRARLYDVDASAICTSIIVAAELRYGCARKGSERLSRAVEQLLSELSVLAFEAPADREYGAVRQELEAIGRPIGWNDTLIAAHARSIGATIVTGNDREFGRVRGLKVENWLA